MSNRNMNRPKGALLQIGNLVLASAALAILGLVGIQGTAHGDNRGIAEALGPLNWGDDSETVLKAFEKELWDLYHSQRQNMSDTLEIDKLRAATARQIDEMKTRIANLTKDSNEYRVSIIDGEFARGTGESVLRLDDANSQRYFFFFNDKLWKTFIAYNADRLEGVAFDLFVQQLVSRYGTTADRRFKNQPGMGLVLNEALWIDSITELRARNVQDVYDTFVLVFTDREVNRNIDKLRRAAAPANPDGKKPSLADMLIEKATSHDDDERSLNIVDKIISGGQEKKAEDATSEESLKSE